MLVPRHNCKCQQSSLDVNTICEKYLIDHLIKGNLLIFRITYFKVVELIMFIKCHVEKTVLIRQFGDKAVRLTQANKPVSKP